jgi:hypothetical protein
MTTAAAIEVSPLREEILDLVKLGLAEHGIPGSATTLQDQVEVIRNLASESLAPAFSLWSHRMTTEYLLRFGKSEWAKRTGEGLRSGELIGSTALATALVDASGRAELPITFEVVDGKFVFSGQIPWASNIAPDTITVFAARNADGQRFVFASALSELGFVIKCAPELLDLNETNSGCIQLHGVTLSEDHVLSESLIDFLKVMRPRFLSLQSAFVLGVARASLQFSLAAKDAEIFSSDLALLSARLEHLESELTTLVGQLDGSSEVQVARPYLQLRLDAALFAQSATRLEFALGGGRAFSVGSDTARRVHESLFFSVQSPTEGALRWELSQSA